MYLASLQRLLQYASSVVPQEPEWHTDADALLSNSWPTGADIEFKDVSLRYTPNGRCAITNLSLRISSGQRIGVAGRTGAGKSSLLAVLFRSRDPCAGAVTIRGVDIRTLGIQTLRRKLAVIPQHPILIAGSVLQNLDPFGEYEHDATVLSLQ
eukprot:TRINITY_DN46396_c0_g1_i1.p1 TRINITY_DN46396_c0_g1~~TRINITY_DN46396_c0_g1_i1.p1  ORF type:complete len:153 (+),score=25.22 TRINITY_DN46396_c0_g1_i1:115-573(+)